MAGACGASRSSTDAGVTALVCHPDAMTPDGNPLLGPMPGRARLLARGGALAERLRRRGRARQGARRARDDRREPRSTCSRIARGASAGRTAIPISQPRARARSTSTTTGSAIRTTRRRRGGPKRLSPLHGRLQELGAVFGTKNGWERADYFRPGEPWRRAGEDQRTFGWARPPYHDRVAVEHAAMRERVGIIDMTSFGKLEVFGSRRAARCSSACATTGSTSRSARSSTRSCSTSAAASSAT